MIISLNDIFYSYSLGNQVVPVLHDISLQINSGELVAIQGPSGSGKSTLLYLIGCLLKIQQGSLAVFGNNINTADNETLAKLRNTQIGFVFQQFHLLPHLNVLENILLPNRYLPLTSKSDMLNLQNNRVQNLVQNLGLDHYLAYLPNQLSGGQQQRVAIARALINNPSLILADEPTGNLDSRSSDQIMKIFADLHQAGSTIIIITHNTDIAAKCQTIYHLRDGHIDGHSTSLQKNIQTTTNCNNITKKTNHSRPISKNFRNHCKILCHKLFQISSQLLPEVYRNLNINLTRSILSMIGITLGIAALLTMITLGQYTKKHILKTYQDLGVNTLVFHGYPNWQLTTTERVGLLFDFFNWEKDIQPLKQIFPQIKLISPWLNTWSSNASFGGRNSRNLNLEINISGYNVDGLDILDRSLLVGRKFTNYDIETSNHICIIGYQIGKKMFATINPIGQVLTLNWNDATFGCHIVGVFREHKTTNKWDSSDNKVAIPYTYFQAISTNFFDSQIRRVLLKIDPTADIEITGTNIKNFFIKKYGTTGQFDVNLDSVLVAQMNKFINLFTIFLVTIALITLSVGAIGIANMMLTSVAERFREIGIRKAIGATDQNIRIQFLLESTLLCSISGAIGLLAGFGLYQTVIYLSTKFTDKIPFEWVINPAAIIISITAIFIVSILSGLIPALKAERLQVIDALRAE